MWAVKTKCWRRRMFLFPLSPPCEHPVDLLLGLLLLPPLLYYPNSGAQWEYPVVRCELAGNNKQWAAYRSTGGPIRIPDTLLLLLPLLLLLLLQYPNRWAHTETWHCSSASVNSSTIACCSTVPACMLCPIVLPVTSSSCADYFTVRVLQYQCDITSIQSHLSAAADSYILPLLSSLQ